MKPASAGRIMLETPEAQASALGQLARSARLMVRIFSDTLAPALFDTEELAKELSRLARQGPPCEVRILIKDSHSLRKRGHRLAELNRWLVSALQLRKLDEDPELHVANYMLADGSGVLFMPNEAEKLCFWNPEDRAFCKYLAERFDELWYRSSPDPELRFMPM